MLSTTLICGASLLALALAAPLDSRDGSGSSFGCQGMVQIIEIVNAEVPAAAYCSSYLKMPTAPVTTTVTSTSTTTSYTGATSTSVVFKSGNPPTTTTNATSAAKRARAISPGDISAACSCMSLSALPTHSTTVTMTKTITTTPAVHTTTVYPCADAMPTLTPTMPYGDATNSLGFSTANTLYYITNTPEGASAQACCNTCFFGVANCVNAFWYSYEGCVVQQATDAAGNGVGNSTQCPSGQMLGLTYANDTAPAFRATGNIAGPCGVSYSNLE